MFPVQQAREEWAHLKWQVNIWVCVKAGCIPWSQLLKSRLISKWALKASSSQLCLSSLPPPGNLWLWKGLVPLPTSFLHLPSSCCPSLHPAPLCFSCICPTSSWSGNMHIVTRQLNAPHKSNASGKRMVAQTFVDTGQVGRDRHTSYRARVWRLFGFINVICVHLNAAFPGCGPWKVLVWLQLLTHFKTGTSTSHTWDEWRWPKRSPVAVC